MSKRGHEEEIVFLSKRLKKLKEALKHSSNKTPASPSSCSTCSSTSSSPSTSRHASPVPDYQNDRDTSTRTVNEAVDTLTSRDVQPLHDAHDPQGDAPQSPQPGCSTMNATIAPPAPEVQSPSAPASSEPFLAATEPPVTPDGDICQTDLIEILGTDPSIAVEYGEEINKEVALRFEYIATKGLDNDMKKELLEKYLVPSNAKLVAAPLLNAEIKAAVTDIVIRRDKAIESRQKQISTAITNIGRILTSLLSKKHKDNELLKQLMDTGRILCDIQHTESETRRNFALYSLKKEVKEQLAISKIDKYLFGTELPEALKTAKAVSKSSIDLKAEANKKFKPLPSASTAKNLNWRAGPAARRQPAGPQHRHYRQPADAPRRRRHHTSSSNKSSHQHKHTRRR